MRTPGCVLSPKVTVVVCQPGPDCCTVRQPPLPLADMLLETAALLSTCGALQTVRSSQCQCTR
jgi:hypothetical protein